MLPSDRQTLIPGLNGTVLKCPWHRWEFDMVTGKCLHAGDSRRLARYDTMVSDREILVDLREHQPA
jgi:nitrite reductase/ring-hydroxylating ferredoxin subunit